MLFETVHKIASEAAAAETNNTGEEKTVEEIRKLTRYSSKRLVDHVRRQSKWRLVGRS